MKKRANAFESLHLPPIVASSTLTNLLKGSFFIFLFFFVGMFTYSVYLLTINRTDKYNDLKEARISSWVGPVFITSAIVCGAGLFYVLQKQWSET